MQKINYQKQLDKIIENLGDKVPSLLLHSCCAPCSSYCIEYLSQYFNITVLYYNPNIYPETEYEKRKVEQKRLISEMETKYPVKMLDCDFESEKFYEMAKGLEAASKIKDESYIYKYHGSTMKEYERILSVIAKNNTIFPNGSQIIINETDSLNEEISVILKEELSIELNVLKEQLETFEFDGVQNALNRLFEYQYEGIRLDVLLAAVKDKVDAFDFMSASEELESVILKMR